MTLAAADTNIYEGLTIIKAVYTTALVRAELGALYVPEALATGFSGGQLSTLAGYNWYPDANRGGMRYLFNYFIPS